MRSRGRGCKGKRKLLEQKLLMSHQRRLFLLDVHLWPRMSLPEGCNNAGLWMLSKRPLQGSPVDRLGMIMG
jgi:hypothetical protein